jgi:S1-C subfamily serine protease
MDTADVAARALRMLRRVESAFDQGPSKKGSAFVWTTAGVVVTCAHVVQHEGANASKVTVDGRASTIIKVIPALDIAYIGTPDQEVSEAGDSTALRPGDGLVFAGFPSGVITPSVFGGLVSAVGEKLLDSPSCRLIQISGMINFGNSGGPVLSAATGKVVGVVTAKNVPLLKEIDHLREILRSMPQFPSEVGIGKIDFSKFVNLTTQALLSVSTSLRLVQVGVGYAVPVDLFPSM